MRRVCCYNPQGHGRGRAEYLGTQDQNRRRPEAQTGNYAGWRLFRVNSLSIVGCEIFEDWVRSAFLQRIRIEKRVSQVQCFPDGIAFVVQKFDIVVDQGMTNAISRRRELGRNSGIHGALVTSVGSQCVRSEKGGRNSL